MHGVFFKITANWSKLLPSDIPALCISEMFLFIYRVIYFAIHSLFMTLHHAEMHFLDCLQSHPGVINVLLHFVDWKMSCVNEQSREGRQRGGREKETQVHEDKGREQTEISPRTGRGKAHLSTRYSIQLILMSKWYSFTHVRKTQGSACWWSLLTPLSWDKVP